MYWWSLTQRMSTTGLAHLTGWLAGQKNAKRGTDFFGPLAQNQRTKKVVSPPGRFDAGINSIQWAKKRLSPHYRSQSLIS